MTIGIPTVICGNAHTDVFPATATPFRIPLDSEIGPVCVQDGLVESEVPAVQLALT